VSFLRDPHPPLRDVHEYVMRLVDEQHLADVERNASDQVLDRGFVHDRTYCALT
jgi:hypothetical protein